MLKLLTVENSTTGKKRPSIEFLEETAWGIGSKIAHFKELHKRTGIDYKDIVFFDDESRNRDVEKVLGVTFVLVRNGVDWKLFNKGIDMWRDRTSQTK
jgi:magnesium-dependent phosphatase 1